MTKVQKAAMQTLLEGGNIAAITNEKFSVRDSMHNPIIRIGRATFDCLKSNKYIKRANDKSSLWVVDKQTIIKMSKRYTVKKMYRESLRKEKIPSD